MKYTCWKCNKRVKAKEIVTSKKNIKKFICTECIFEKYGRWIEYRLGKLETIIKILKS